MTQSTSQGQKRRPLILVRGIDDLASFEIVGFTAAERLSTAFEIELELKVKDPDTFDIEALAEATIGKPVSIDVSPSDSPADTHRRFHGEAVAARDVYSAEPGAIHMVVVEIRPALWRLTRYVDTRLFSDKTARNIVEELLEEYGVVFRWHDAPTKKHNIRPHTWQLDETDMAFVQRLLENEGYSFWFTFDDTGHTMHIADGPQRLPTLTGDPLQIGRLGKGALGKGHVAYLRRTLSAVPSTCIVRGRSVDGESVLQGRAENKRTGSSGTVNATDGHVESQSQCKRAAEQRLASLQTSRVLVESRSDIRALSAGTVVSIMPGGPSTASAYRVIGVRHEANQSTAEYGNAFEAVADDAPFAVAHQTVRPTLSVARATVVGQPDENGCFPLRFDIDRLQGDSAPVPLGRDTDTVFLPRVGHRVEVGFVENDPDRPTIHRMIDPPGTMPFDPSQHPRLGGVFTPTHTHAFNHDPDDSWTRMETLGNFEDLAGGERTVTTAKDRAEFVLGDADWSVGENVNWHVEGSHASRAGKKYTIEAETLVLAGTKRIVFMVGRSYIAISNKGITVVGKPLVHLNPPGARKPKKPAAPNIPKQGKGKKPKHSKGRSR